MNWLSRYVGAVKSYLPQRTRDDVGEELQALLEERLDEARDEKGEAIPDADVLALLKEFGHPLEVASRYGNRRVLIGESLFPIYKQALKYLVLVFFTLYLASILIARSGILEWWPRGMHERIEHVGLAYLVLITVAFHLLDRYLSNVDFFAKWDPRRLPPAYSNRAGIPLVSSMVALVLVVAWFAILTAIHNEYSWALLTGRSDNPFASLILWLKMHALLVFALHAYNIFQPYWTRSKLVFDAFSSFVFSFVAIMALRIEDAAETFLHAMGGNLDSEAGAEWMELTDAMDPWIRINLWVIALIVIGVALSSLYRAFKLRRLD